MVASGVICWDFSPAVSAKELDGCYYLFFLLTYYTAHNYLFILLSEFEAIRPYIAKLEKINFIKICYPDTNHS